MHRKARVCFLLLAGVFALAVAGCPRTEARSSTDAAGAQSNTGQSRVRAETLLRKVAAALCRQDRETLERLAVSDEEYRARILPGSVPPGEQWVAMPERKADFFTRLHRTKSIYALNALLAACPIGSLEFQGVDLPQPEQRAGYTLYRNPRLLFRDGGGAEVELRPGSVVVFEDKVKILSYFAD